MTPGGEGSGHAGGLFASARNLAATLVALLHTRLELLSTEAEAQLLRWTRLLLLAAISLFLLALAIVGVTFLVVVAFWDSHRLAAIAVMAGIHLAGGIGVALYARRLAQAQPSLFASTLAELAKDREELQGRRDA